jgi:benzoyl-CoA reductase/2-hydroxyglutaryl-CoA dehydratase subunit BcrC/BadD/HgdB
MAEKKTRRLQSARAIGATIRKFYEDAWAKRPIAWSVATANPLADICTALGIQVVYPGNYACICAAQHLSEKYCSIAEGYNYKRELCSYIRNVFGYILAGEGEHPMGGIPEPDVIVSISNSCLNYLKWFDAMHLYFDKPFVFLNTPHRLFEHDIPDYYLDYVLEELKICIEQLEKISGNRLTEQKLKEVAHYSREQGKYWRELLELNKSVPAPVNLSDLANLIFIPTSLSGTAYGLELLKEAVAEVRERVRNKVGVIPEERRRLVMFNIPPWYRLGFVDYFAERGCVFPFGNYNRYLWNTQDIDDADPLEYLVRKGLSFGYDGGYGSTLAETLYSCMGDRLAQDIKDYKIDGAVILINKSCKIMSIGELDLATLLREKYRLPVLVIDVDQAEERAYSDAEIKQRVDAFLEMIGV